MIGRLTGINLSKAESLSGGADNGPITGVWEDDPQTYAGLVSAWIMGYNSQPRF
jgi:hypothetical protein